MRLRAVLAISCVAACYSPATDPDCLISCATSSECPAAQGCGASGLCSGSNACVGDLDGGVTGDVPIGSDAGTCGTGFFQTCGSATPAMVTLTGTLDTTTDPRCSNVAQMVGQPEVCVIAAGTIDAELGFRATGARALVLVATVVNLRGLDVSSFRATPSVHGAGSCTATAISANGSTGQSTSSQQFGAGGAGGRFQGRGGRGGDAIGNQVIGAGGAPAAAITFPDHVEGGCIAGVGDQGGVSGGAGAPGHGGGAVYVIARDEILVTGTVSACGAGGLHSDINGGGGGGGAGGLIVFDAPNVRLTSTSRIVASGGGGAAGGSGSGGGNNGGDPTPSASTAAGIVGVGGTSFANAGVGGQGSTDVNHDGQAATNGASAGGGGGGGAAGFIVIYAANLTNSAMFVIPALTPPL